MRLLPKLLLLILLSFICCGAGAQQKTPSKTSDKGTWHLTPTRDKRTKSGLYVPKDLDDALKELRHLLPPKAVSEMQKSTENEMWRYHLSFGMWLRNNWGLWRGERLAEWFNTRGIHHPDDMSGIILISFWRSLHKKPIGLDTQIKFYKAYAEEAKKSQAEEEERVRKVRAQITRLMLGLQPQSIATVPEIALPARSKPGIQVRYAAPFFVGGALLTAKINSGSNDEDFITPAYVLDIARQRLRPVEVPEIARIENAVVLDYGATAYFHGSASGAAGKRQEVVLEIKAGHRRLLPSPPGAGFIRLGLGAHNDLLVVRPRAIYRWRPENKSSQQREPLYTTSAKTPLPRSGVPPQIWGDRIYFRDEGRNEDNKRLSWVNLTPVPKSGSMASLVYFDHDTGMVGSYGPRWENVWSYAYATGGPSVPGTLWLSTGDSTGLNSLLRWTPQEGYRVALFNGGIRLGSDFFEKGKVPDNIILPVFAVTGMEPYYSETTRGSGIHAVSRRGFFDIEAGQINTLVLFEDSTQSIPMEDSHSLDWNWIPTHILTLSPRLTLLGGHFGGVYILSKPVIAEDAFHLTPLDEELGPPIRL